MFHRLYVTLEKTVAIDYESDETDPIKAARDADDDQELWEYFPPVAQPPIEQSWTVVQPDSLAHEFLAEIDQA